MNPISPGPAEAGPGAHPRLSHIQSEWCRFLLLLTAAVFGTFAGAGADSFVAGADYSHLAFFEQRGIVYREKGQPRDGLAILTNAGLTCVRLRLFTSGAAQAQGDPYNYINNLDYTLALAQRVKRAGLRLMLDFHYSDTWADPGKQAKPSAWSGLTFPQLNEQLRAYSSNCIVAFREAGAMPDYVQPGNEIISGFLWPDGRVGGSYDTPVQWSKFAQLLTNAIAGIRDGSGGYSPGIIIHIDRGGDWAGTQWFFDNLLQQSVPFDIIGQSYYPFWHGSLEALGVCLTNTVQRYGKPLMIAETAFPWTNSADLYGFPATPAGQARYAAALARIVRSLPGGRGAGIVWWGTEYQAVSGVSLAGFDQRSFYGLDGNVLPVAQVFGGMVAPVRLAVQGEAGSLVLTWPLSGTAYSLMTATGSPDVPWALAASAVTFGGTNFSAMLPLTTGTNRFYRLKAW